MTVLVLVLNVWASLVRQRIDRSLHERVSLLSSTKEVEVMLCIPEMTKVKFRMLNLDLSSSVVKEM